MTMENLSKQLDDIKIDIRSMNEKLTQVMAFMAMMQGADIKTKQEDAEQRIRILESWKDKFSGAYTFIGGSVLIIGLLISVVSLIIQFIKK